MRGRANIEMLNSPKPKYETIKPVTVDQIFAPTRIAIALTRDIIPELTKPSVSREIRVLLLSIAVTIVPVRVAFATVFVYFCKMTRSLVPHSFLSASSNISIPKRIIPSQANNTHRFIQL